VRVELASTITEVIHAKTAHEIDEVRRLFREYEAYLNVDLCFQEFESELANLPGKYAPPFGTLLLTTDGRKSIGCGALRSLGAGKLETPSPAFDIYP
jgi:putative acetyltransferase